MIKLFEWVKNNFYLFGTTAFPGVHKIVLLFVINAVFSLEITADFINDIFILYLLGYYTVFNWSNFILVDMMKLTKEKHQVFFGKILGLSFWSNLPLIIALFAIYKLGWISDFYGFSFLVITWSYHQLWRHYLISKKRFRNLFFSDTIILTFSILLIILASKLDWNIYFLLSFPVLVIPLCMENLLPVFEYGRFNSRVYKRAMNYTLINLTIGGIQLIFAPISHHLLSAEMTRSIGFTSNLANVALLFPRALSFQFIPQLSGKVRQGREEFKKMFFYFLKKNNQVIVAMFILGLVTGITFWVTFFNFPPQIIGLSLVVFVNVLIGQLAGPSSNALVVKAKSDELLTVNLFSFCVVIIQMVLVVNSNLDGVFKMFFLLIFNMFIGVLRHWYLLKRVRKIL